MNFLPLLGLGVACAALVWLFFVVLDGLDVHLVESRRRGVSGRGPGEDGTP